jgi:hypothetical protein
MPYSLGTVFLEVAPSFDGLQDEARRNVDRAFKDLDQRVAPHLRKLEKETARSGATAGKEYGSAFEREFRTRIKTMREAIKSVDTGSLRSDFRAVRAELKRLEGLDLSKLTNQAEVGKSLDGMRSRINTIFADVEKGQRSASRAALVNLGAVRKQIDDMSKRTSRFLTPQVDVEQQKKAWDELGRLQERATREMDADYAKREQAVRRLANLQEQAGREELRRIREANTERAREASRQIKLDVDQVKREIRVGVIGQEEARAKLALLVADVNRLDRMRAEADVDVPDQTANIIQMRALAQSIEQVGQEASRSSRLLATLDAGSAANSVRVFNGVLFTMLAVGPLLIPMLAALGAGILGVGAAASGALLGVGALVLAFSGIGGAIGAMNELDKAQRAHSAIDSTGSSPRARQAEQDARSIADAERGLARTLRDARRAQAASARAISDAEERLSDARRDSARQQQQSARAIADAEEALADAREESARVQQQSARAIADAETALARTRENASRAATDAARRTADAEERLRDSQKSALRAQVAINQARAEATRLLQDMNFQLRGARLNEQEAEFAVEEALVHYNVVLEDEQATDREKEVARLASEQAQLALEEARVNTKRLEKDTAAANKKGVEGSDLVVAAKERQVEATESVADAEEALDLARADEARTVRDNADAISGARRDVRDAEIEAARAAEDSAERVADAAQNVRDAKVEAAIAAQESARSIADAEEGVADAYRVSAESRVDSAEAIADAQRALGDAQRDAALNAAIGTGALATQVAALDEAMRGLSPAGREFAMFLYGLKPLLDDLRFAAQEGFLPGLQSGLEMIVNTYGPGMVSFVGSMAGVLGDLAKQAGQMFTNPFWKDFFGYMADMAPIFLRQFGEIGLNLLTFFAGITQAFAPLGKELGDALVRMTEGMADWATGLKDTEGFAKFMEYIDRISPKVWELVGTMFSVLGKTLIGLAPYSEQLLDFFIGVFDRLDEMDPDELARIALAFGAIVLAVQALAGVMSLISGTGGLVGGALKMVGVGRKKKGSDGADVDLPFVAAPGGKAAKGGKGGILATLGLGGGAGAMSIFRELGDVIEKVGGKAVVTRVGLKLLGKGLLALLGPVGIAVAAIWLIYDVLTYAYNNVEWFRSAVDTAVESVSAAFSWLWEAVRPVFEAMGAAWTWLRVEIIDPFVNWLWRIFENSIKPAFEYLYKNAIKPTMDLIGAIFKVVWEVIKVFGHIIKEVFEHIVAPAFRWLYEKIVKPIMGWIGDRVEAVWKNNIKPVFQAIGGFIEDKVAPKFRKGVEVIANIWSGILELIRKPLRFVVETVINKGLIGSFNWLAEKTGMDPLKPIPVPNALQPGGQNPSMRAADKRHLGFASGGVLPGYTPGRDVHRFVSPTAGVLDLSGGEGIARPEIVSAIGADRWNAANAAARGGNVNAALGYLGGYAKGGILDDALGWAGDTIDKIKGGASSLAQAISNPKKWLKSIVEEKASESGFTRTPLDMVTSVGNKVASGIGDWIKGLVGLGDGGGATGAGGGGRGKVYGVSAMTAALRGIDPSAYVTSGFRGGARTATGYTSYHGLGRAIDIVSPNMGRTWDLLRAAYGGTAKELFYTPRGFLRNGVMGGAAQVTRDTHHSHVHWAMANGGIVPTLYDSGGDLPPGLSLVANQTGKPESVMTDAMMEELGSSRAAAMSISFAGANIGYDPAAVATAIARRRSDELAMAGLNDGGDPW